MTVKKTKVALPVEYRETLALTCDACGKQATELMTGGLTEFGGVRLPLSGLGSFSRDGWFIGFQPMYSAKLGLIDLESTRVDYCDECWKKIQKVIEVEVKNIVADRLAAAAEAVGVSVGS